MLRCYGLFSWVPGMDADNPGNKTSWDFGQAIITDLPVHSVLVSHW